MELLLSGVTRFAIAKQGLAGHIDFLNDVDSRISRCETHLVNQDLNMNLILDEIKNINSEIQELRRFFKQLSSSFDAKRNASTRLRQLPTVRSSGR